MQQSKMFGSRLILAGYLMTMVVCICSIPEAHAAEWSYVGHRGGASPGTSTYGSLAFTADGTIYAYASTDALAFRVLPKWNPQFQKWIWEVLGEIIPNPTVLSAIAVDKVTQTVFAKQVTFSSTKMESCLFQKLPDSEPFFLAAPCKPSTHPERLGRGSLSVSKEGIAIFLSDDFVVTRFETSSGMTEVPRAGAPAVSSDQVLAVKSTGSMYILSRLTGVGATVHVFDNNEQKWIELRGGKISGEDGEFDFVIDHNDVLVAVYASKAGVRVFRYDETLNEFVALGKDGVTATPAAGVRVNIDSNSIPHVVYTELSGKATMQKWNQDSMLWEVLGAPGFTEGPVYYLDCAFDSKDVPHVAFTDSLSQAGGLLSVMRFA